MRLNGVEQCLNEHGRKVDALNNHVQEVAGAVWELGGAAYTG